MTFQFETRRWICAAAFAVSGMIATAGFAQNQPGDDIKKETAKTEEKAAQDEKKDAGAGEQKPGADGKTPTRIMQPPAVGPQKPATPHRGEDVPQPTIQLKPGEVPAIKFDQTTYDFGKIRAGADINHEFWFSNTGTGPLEILRVKPSCGCTVAGDYDKVVQPGQTGKIPLKMATKKGGGALSKTITVNTNVSGADNTIRLTIKGEVWQPIQVTPASAAFGRLTADKATDDTSRRLTIVNNLDEELKLTNVRSDSAAFKAELQTLEAGKKFELVVTIVPPLQSGNNTGKITMDTGIAEPTTLEVPVYAFVTAPIDVTPSQLTLLPDRTSEMKRQFYIRSNDGKPFEVSEVKCSSDKLKTTITDMRGTKETYQLAIDIPADYAPPATGDTITFKTTHPAAPTMSIPIVSRAAPVKRPLKAGVTPTSAAPATFTGRAEALKASGVKLKTNAGESKDGKPAEARPAEAKPEDSKKDETKKDSDNGSKPTDMKPVN